MLKFLGLITALSTALVPSLPEVAFGLPLGGNINNSSIVSLDSNSNTDIVPVNPNYPYSTGTIYPNSNTGTVPVNPDYPYPAGTIYPNSNTGTVLVNPDYPYSTGIISPNTNPSTVIVNPSGPVIVNSPRRPFVHQNNCSGVIFGSPIPSPTPVNPYTGGRCR